LPGSIKRDDNLTDSLQSFWETESIGIKNDTFSETQTTEFLPEIHFDKGEGRYEVNLPWKQDGFPKSTGFGMCVNRLRQLHSRLKKDNTFLEEYDNKVIQQQINSGMVFDGSARPDIDSPSINECLQKGRNLIPPLFDTIIFYNILYLIQ
jgi:hypothetical protein